MKSVNIFLENATAVAAKLPRRDSALLCVVLCCNYSILASTASMSYVIFKKNHYKL